jgi:tripartite-type tricarboxylate transporter receptor subunit TctC
MKTLSRRAVLGAALGSAPFIGSGVSFAQGYPSKPITAIMPFAGGSASDVVSRITFDRMSRDLGQPIIVENRPGAGGNTGTAAAARMAADGYTIIGGGSGPLAANYVLYKNLGYNPEKDIDIISPFVGFTMIVTVSNKVPVKTLKELIAYAKAHPGQLNYGSVGIGSSQHLAGEYFGQVTGVKITHVPYRNIAQYGPDLIAGTVQLGFQWYPNVAGPLQANGATALAVAGDQRLSLVLPDTPTTTEAGLPEYKNNGWFALCTPGGTPKPILERLHKALSVALKDPAVIESFAKQGAVPILMPLDQVRKFQHEEINRYRDIITKAGISQIQ